MSGAGSSGSSRSAALAGLLVGAAATSLLGLIMLRGSGRSIAVAKRRPRAICFGDSLTQFGYQGEHKGWVGLLSDHYSRKLDVVNRGFSGYNTRWCRLMMHDLFGPQGDDLARNPPALVTVFLGANDATLPGCSQHVPYEEYKANLRAIVSYFQALGPDVCVVVMTPPPLHEADWHATLGRLLEAEREERWRAVEARGDESNLPLGAEPRPPLDRSHNVSRMYGEAAKEVAAERGVPAVDLYEALDGPKAANAYREHLSDGLHLSATGNLRVVWELVRVLGEEWPWMDAQEVPMQAPDWKEIGITGKQNAAAYAAAASSSTTTTTT